MSNSSAANGLGDAFASPLRSIRFARDSERLRLELGAAVDHRPRGCVELSFYLSGSLAELGHGENARSPLGAILAAGPCAPSRTRTHAPSGDVMNGRFTVSAGAHSERLRLATWCEATARGGTLREIDHPPSAPSLMESMRSMGYSLGAALADLIDNSVTARASNVSLLFSALDEPYIALLDDGVGMDEADLDQAMRHGSRSPSEHRAEDDLGRFGLGLKTASLSQCKRMTVVSIAGGRLNARTWDMDVVNARRGWILLALDDDDLSGLPGIEELQVQGHGTLVLWQKLDRLLTGESDPYVALGRLIAEARDHLALVFHRYLQGEQGTKPLRLRLNGTDVEGRDPYLLNNGLTQRLPDDSFEVDGHRIKVKAYILPHPSRLPRPEVADDTGEGLRGTQGFYVYRQRRLIIWGTWFRLARKDELGRLARVRVDIPNSLDHLWTLDIRKAIANPPETVRRNLRRTIERIRAQSRETHVARGYRERVPETIHAWSRVFANGKVRYDINPDHEAIRSFRDALNTTSRRGFDAVIRILQASFPIESLYVDMASEERVAGPAESPQELRSLAAGLLAGLPDAGAARASLLANLHVLEPFSAQPDLARAIARELCN